MVRGLSFIWIVCGCLLAAAPSYPVEKDGGRDKEASNRSNNPAEHLKVPELARSNPAAPKPPNEETDVARGSEYARRELEAQEETAFWTRWMAYAALIALFLSAAGVALVYRTFATTRGQSRIALKEFGRARLQARRAAADASDTVAQAARSADAMENVAESMAINAAQVVESVATSKRIADAQQDFSVLQMRAYLSVIVGGAFYQERAKNLRFQANPEIVNSGSTPAKNVAYRIKAAILPYPAPDGAFEDGSDLGDEGFIPPNQTRYMSAAVTEFVADELVPRVRAREGLSLYVWGEVTYDDVFGNGRHTKFGHSIFWMPAKDGFTIHAEYLPGMNDAD